MIKTHRNERGDSNTLKKGRTARIRNVLSLAGAPVGVSGYFIVRMEAAGRAGTSVGPMPLILEKEESVCHAACVSELDSVLRQVFA